MQRASQGCASGSDAVVCKGWASQERPTPAFCNAGASQPTDAPETLAAAAGFEGAAGSTRSPAAAAAATPAPDLSAFSLNGGSTAAAVKSAGEIQPAGRASAAPATSDSASATDHRSSLSATKLEGASQLAVRAGGATSGPEPSVAAPAAEEAEGASQPAGRMGDSSGPESHALAPEDWLDLASVPPSGYATRQGSGLQGHEAEGRSAAGAPTRMVGS